MSPPPPRRSLLIALCAVFLALVCTSTASATIPRTSGAWLFGPQPVWTDGTVNPLFHPMSRSLEAYGLIDVRVSFEMSENTGDCQIRPALRYSNDGVSWGSSKDIVGSYRTANGITFQSGYVDITGAGFTPGAYVQFGVEVKNGSNGAIQHSNATLRVERKQK